MKTLGILSVAVAMSGWMASYGQEMEAEVPGDHFSLEGALELFKQSASPEEFEELLNSPDSKVNNLDLNGDGYIDYIRVFDRQEGNVHIFILQAVVSERESQDVAVIELEKLANGKAVLQIIGNEDIYGVETIIEPTREVRTYAGTTTSRVYVNVWAWPSVRYIYGPYYSGWISPWGWHIHPGWWHPWRPVVYVNYYNTWYPYHHHYAVCHTRRVVYAHHIYRPYRTTSVVVHNRYHDRIRHYRSAHPNGHRHQSDRYGRHNGGSRSDRTYTHDRQRTEYNRHRDDHNPSSTGSRQQKYRTTDLKRRFSDGPDAGTSRFNTGRPVTTDRGAQQITRPSTVKKSRSPGSYNLPQRSTNRTGTIPHNRTQPVTKPATVNKDRSSGNYNVPQRSTGRTGTVQHNRSTQQVTRPPATVNKSRSSGNYSVPQRSTSRTGTVQHNRSTQQVTRPPATINKSRSSGNYSVPQRSTGRTGTVQHNRSTQQVTRPPATINKSRSSGSHNTQQGSGSNGTKGSRSRGRN